MLDYLVTGYWSTDIVVLEIMVFFVPCFVFNLRETGEKTDAADSFRSSDTAQNIDTGCWYLSRNPERRY